MIRVGLPLFGWQGGRRYLANLLRALRAAAASDVVPVLLCDHGAAEDAAFAGVERSVRDGPLASATARRVGGLLRRTLRRDLVEARWLRRARVDVYSHGRVIGRVGIPSIYWIGDMQHRVLPEMFSRTARLLRDEEMSAALDLATLVIASSETSRRELIEAFGRRAERTRVLPFATDLAHDTLELGSLRVLPAGVQVPARYVFLPNQFWRHKNHLVVLEALRAAPAAVVVATGPRDDPRHPGHFQALMDRVHAWGLTSRFQYLGTVDDHTLLALMRNARALLNPSRFEGWSTSVEEAKALGKHVLLSDLAVHREQAPARARYFAPDDARGLALALEEAMTLPDDDDDTIRTALHSASARVRAYGEAYAALVRSAHSQREGRA